MMATIRDHARRLLRDCAAATSIEYGLIAVFLSILCVVGARTIGSNLAAHFFTPIANTLN